MEKSDNASKPATLAARIARLTRWDEHVLFTVPATLLGVNVALERSDVALDGRVMAILLANVLGVAFAFVVNDIEDAADDRHDPARAAHNVVAAGGLTPRTAWRAAAVVGGLSLVAYALVNERALIVGASVLLLGGLYSWRSVRLKALPVLDVLAHVLMLSSLLFLGGYVAYARLASAIWPVAVGVGLISAYGQLYNQLRDYAQDRAAGLHNTASVLGPHGTRRAMYGALAAAVASLLLALLRGLIPGWFALVIVLLSPVVLLFRTGRDMRGSRAINASGSLQTGAMALATLGMLVWLLVQIAQ